MIPLCSFILTMCLWYNILFPLEYYTVDGRPSMKTKPVQTLVFCYVKNKEFHCSLFSIAFQLCVLNAIEKHLDGWCCILVAFIFLSVFLKNCLEYLYLMPDFICYFLLCSFDLPLLFQADQVFSLPVLRICIYMHL